MRTRQGGIENIWELEYGTGYQGKQKLETIFQKED